MEEIETCKKLYKATTERVIANNVTPTQFIVYISCSYFGLQVVSNECDTVSR